MEFKDLVVIKKNNIGQFCSQHDQRCAQFVVDASDEFHQIFKKTFCNSNNINTKAKSP